MPLTASRKKSLRQSQTRKVRNLGRKRAMKEAVKAVNQALQEGDADQIAAAVTHAQKCIDKAVKQGLIKQNTASRRKAQMARRSAAARS